MHKKMFFLLLKQGIRGVFKFKIQFLIIIFLSFLATFMLSTSFSTVKRIDNNYNNIMNKIDKFDYINSFKLGNSLSGGIKTTNMAVFTDFINDEYLQTGIYDGKDNPNKTDFAYNLNFSDFNLSSDSFENTYKETFITKTFKDKNFIDVFDNYIGLKTNDYSEDYGSWTQFSYDPFEMNYTYNPYNMIDTDDSVVYTYNEVNRIFPELTMYLNKNIRKNLIIDLQNDKKYLQNTTIKKLIDNNVFNINYISKDPYDQKIDSLGINNYIDTLIKGIVTHIDYTLSYYVSNVVSNAILEFNSNSGENNKSNMKNFIDYFNNDFISNHSTNKNELENFIVPFKLHSKKSISNPNIDNEMIKKTQDFMYSYLLGKESLSKKSNLDVSGLVVNSDFGPWAEKIDRRKDKNQLTKVITDIKEIRKYGLRGSANQNVGHIITGVKIEDDLYYNNFYEATKIFRLLGITKSMTLSENIDWGGGGI